MPSSNLFTALSLALLVLLASTAFAADGCALDDVIARDTALNAAIRQHDVAAAAQIYADAFILTTSRGQRKNKTDLLSEIGSPALTLTINETHDVQLFGDAKTAVLIGRLHQQGEFVQADASAPQRFDVELLVTDTWVCAANGHWQLLAGHATRR